MPELSADEIAQVVRVRAAKPFRSRAEIAQVAKKAAADAINKDLDVKSAFFSVRVQVAQDEVELAADALVKRGDNASTAIIWRRSRY